MACDIAKSLFRTLAAEGLVFTADDFRSLEVRYVRLAQDTIARYYADAMMNGLKFDRHAEETGGGDLRPQPASGGAGVHRRSAGPAAHPQLESRAGGHSGISSSCCWTPWIRMPGRSMRGGVNSEPMAEIVLTEEAARAVEIIGQGRHCYRHPKLQQRAHHRPRSAAANAGLAKYFPQSKRVIVNSDGGSKDGTARPLYSRPWYDDAPC